MGAVSIAEAWPPAGQPFTVGDLDRMPDDGHRYELLGGVLVVSPRPSTVHQAVIGMLTATLVNARPKGLTVVPEPAVQLTSDTEFDPDIVVVRSGEVGGTKFTRPPLLAVEIRSPSTALVDLNAKKKAYERFGVHSYWIVDPDLRTPSLTVFELRDGHYEQAAQARGAEAARIGKPFPVTVVPAELVAAIGESSDLGHDLAGE
jgi:Uma2 family endonuclease